MYGLDSAGEVYEFTPFKPDYRLPARAYLDRSEEGQEALLCYTDAEAEDQGACAEFFCLSSGRLEEDVYGAAGLIQISLPVRAFSEHLAISDFFREICQIAVPIQGTAGFGLTCPVDRREAHLATVENGRYQDAIETFPALEANAREDDPGDNDATLETGYKRTIRTTGWLTILGNSMLKRLGGRSHIIKVISDHPSIEIVDYGEGVIIRCGNWPILGDKHDRPLPKEYGVVARLVKPLRCKLTRPTMLYGSNYESYEERDKAFAKWRARFDNF